MKEQIKEMANDIAKICPDLVENSCGQINCVTHLTLSLYKAGYRKQSEWISVDDRLPHELKKPILVTDGEKVIVAYRNWLYRSNSTGELRCPANYGNGMKVTHWMPLPEPPKGE